MAKQYKIKRYRQYASGNSFRAKPHPVAIVLTVLAFVVLAFIGYNIYEPLLDFITSDHSPGEIELPDPTAEPPSSPIPEPEPAPAVLGGMRAAYLPTATARDAAALQAFLDGLSGSGVNAVMVDIKDQAGNVLFASSNASAIEWGAVVQDPLDLHALSQTLEQNGLWLVARMSAFRDSLAASAERAYAISYLDSDWLWLDNTVEAGGRPWLNPYSSGARDYLSALALEAVDAGARMVVVENLQFPVGSLNNASFGPGSENIGRSQILRSFFEELSATLEEKGARTAVYLTAISLTQDSENETRYGGSPLDMAAGDILLGALPYQFGGSYDVDGLTVEQPMQDPGAAVESILAYALPRLPEHAGAVIPLLMGGAEPEQGAPTFTPGQVDAQIEAVRASGLDEYFLFCTTGSYIF